MTREGLDAAMGRAGYEPREAGPPREPRRHCSGCGGWVSTYSGQGEGYKCLGLPKAEAAGAPLREALTPQALRQACYDGLPQDADDDLYAVADGIYESVRAALAATPAPAHGRPNYYECTVPGCTLDGHKQPAPDPLDVERPPDLYGAIQIVRAYLGIATPSQIEAEEAARLTARAAVAEPPPRALPDIGPERH